MKKSVYQTKEYEKALGLAGENIIKITDNFFCVENSVKFPIIGKRTIRRYFI